MGSNQNGKKAASGDAKQIAETRSRTPRSLAIAQAGVKTANDFAVLMSALMGDLIEGAITAEVGNSTCKAGSNLLKVVEMQHKYGTASPPAERKILQLTT